MQGTTGRLCFFVVILFCLSFTSALFCVPAASGGTQATNGGDHLLKGVDKEMGTLARSVDRESGTPGGIGTFIETILILTLFVSGLYMLFRFIQKKKGTSVSGETAIKLLSSRSVGGNRMLQIVEVGNQIFFIGLGDGSINLIAEIEDKETVDWLRMQYLKGPAAVSAGFIEKLFNVFGKAGGKPPGRGSKIDFVKKQRSRLKELDDDN